MDPLIADGGLATTLQREGLAPFAPADDWILARPEAVAAVHAAFVEAGARIVLTATFSAATRPDASLVVESAVSLAHRALAGRAELWGSLGPMAAPSATRTVALALRGHVRGLVLETFASPEACVAALDAVGDLGVPVVASLTVRPDGALWDGRAAGPAMADLLERGAAAVGLNCAEPEAIRAACDRWEGPPLWLRPGRLERAEGPWLDVAASLRSRAAVLGGCCGVPPELLAALAGRLGLGNVGQDA